jgi:hypothetical protein
MALPAWEESGLLPPGAHKADLPDIYERFVVDAPVSNRDQRELLFGALTTHLRLIQRIIPAGIAWIDGSFATRRESPPPEDVDVAVRPADWDVVEALPSEARARLYLLITMQDVAVMQPTLWFSKLRPVGGLIDAYLCRPGQEATWHEEWSRVTDAAGVVIQGQVKGYAEVEW